MEFLEDMADKGAKASVLTYMNPAGMDLCRWQQLGVPEDFAEKQMRIINALTNMVVAAMVVGFITQGFRSEERRPRLLLAGPLTPRQLAGVMVLLPTTLIGLGLIAAALSISVVSLLLGRLQPESLRIVAGVTGQFFAIVQLGPLAQESTAARRQRRNGPAFAGWVVFASSILVLVACQFFLHSAIGQLTQVLVGVTAMAVSARLCVGRTDFTR